MTVVVNCRVTVATVVTVATATVATTTVDDFAFDVFECVLSVADGEPAVSVIGNEQSTNDDDDDGDDECRRRHEQR